MIHGDQPEAQVLVNEYEVLTEFDVVEAPGLNRPIGPGDVFESIALPHLAEPFNGPVIVVGHPCSLRRGVDLEADVPVAPIEEPGISRQQRPHTDRQFPVRKLLPPNSDRNRAVRLARTTTVPATVLQTTSRVASLKPAGVVALQQRILGNQSRVRISAKRIMEHCRGPLTEIEIWTDWRDACEDSGQAADSEDAAFDAFMCSPSPYPGLSWRQALEEREDAKGRVGPALDAAVERLLGAHGSESF